MSIVCRVLPYERADGPANMALDEALLDVVAAGEQAAYLRTYGWTIPTLSLGYFQQVGRGRGPIRAGRMSPLVRRLDGRRLDLAPPRGDVCAGGTGRASAGSSEHEALSRGPPGDRRYSGQSGRSRRPTG